MLVALAQALSTEGGALGDPDARQTRVERRSHDEAVTFFDDLETVADTLVATDLRGRSYTMLPQVKFVPDGTGLVSVDAEVVRSWVRDPATGELTAATANVATHGDCGTECQPNQLLLSADGGHIYVVYRGYVSDDGAAEVLLVQSVARDVDTGALSGSELVTDDANADAASGYGAGMGCSSWAAALSADGGHLYAACDEHLVKVDVDPDTGAIGTAADGFAGQARLEADFGDDGAIGTIQSLVISPTAAFAYFYGYFDGAHNLYRLDRDTETGELTGPPVAVGEDLGNDVTALAISGDGLHVLAPSDDDDQLVSFQLDEDGVRVSATRTDVSITTTGNCKLAMAADGERIIIGNENIALLTRNPETGAISEVDSTSIDGTASISITSSTYSPHGAAVAAGSAVWTNADDMPGHTSICFLIDESGSIDHADIANFTTGVDLIKDVVARIYADIAAPELAVVKFASSSTTEIELGQHDESDFDAALSAMTQNRGGSNDAAAGLELCGAMLADTSFTEPRQAVVLITDADLSASDLRQATAAASALAEDGITVLGVGIGGYLDGDNLADIVAREGGCASSNGIIQPHQADCVWLIEGGSNDFSTTAGGVWFYLEAEEVENGHLGTVVTWGQSLCADPDHCTLTPTHAPTAAPSATPTCFPTLIPTSPTASPTGLPTHSPTPSSSPTLGPTASPSCAGENVESDRTCEAAFRNGDCCRFSFQRSCQAACCSVTCSPTALPTVQPTALPTALPTVLPTTSSPTALPTVSPTAFPTAHPTGVPSHFPTTLPSVSPTGCLRQVDPQPEGGVVPYSGFFQLGRSLDKRSGFYPIAVNRTRRRGISYRPAAEGCPTTLGYGDCHTAQECIWPQAGCRRWAPCSELTPRERMSRIQCTTIENCQPLLVADTIAPTAASSATVPPVTGRRSTTIVPPARGRSDTASSDPDSADGGAIAGAVVGVLAAVAFIAIAAIYLQRRKRQPAVNGHHPRSGAENPVYSADLALQSTPALGNELEEKKFVFDRKSNSIRLMGSPVTAGSTSSSDDHDTRQI